MRILGIDPGYALMGYGVIEQKGNQFQVIDCGSISTGAGAPMPERLKYIYSCLMEIIDQTQPETAALEELFFNTNARTVIHVGQARGVAVLACVNSGLEVAEYTPLQIKQALVGYGRADKTQMQTMVKTLLHLDRVPRPDDTADALAAAICHAHSVYAGNRMEQAVRKALAGDPETIRKKRKQDQGFRIIKGL